MPWECINGTYARPRTCGTFFLPYVRLYKSGMSLGLVRFWLLLPTRGENLAYLSRDVHEYRVYNRIVLSNILYDLTHSINFTLLRDIIIYLIHGEYFILPSRLYLWNISIVTIQRNISKKKKFVVQKIKVTRIYKDK